PEAQCDRDTTIKFTGSASAAVVKTTVKHPWAEAGFSQLLMKLPPGLIHLRGAVKTKDVEGAAYIKLTVRNSNGGLCDVRTTPHVTCTTEWKRYSASIRVPAGASGVVSLVIKGKGTVWFDEVYVGMANDEGGPSFPPVPREVIEKLKELGRKHGF